MTFSLSSTSSLLKLPIRELKQPRRRRQQKPHKFAYLTMKNSIFARFARAFFIFWHFVDVLVLSTTWNDLFCSCVDDVSIWWQMFNFVFLCPKRWFQINSRTVRRYFSSIMTCIKIKGAPTKLFPILDATVTCSNTYRCSNTFKSHSWDNRTKLKENCTYIMINFQCFERLQSFVPFCFYFVQLITKLLKIHS